ncbi:hypothetical protein L1887_18197 [Cichorium endivia]|nr:hypothetical protein L1887_18197 [Cichorium endivia]
MRNGKLKCVAEDDSQRERRAASLAIEILFVLLVVVVNTEKDGDLLGRRTKRTQVEKVVDYDDKAKWVRVTKLSRLVKDVVKPAQFKAINDERTSMYQRSFMKGKLYIHFSVEIPYFLSPEQCKTLEWVLPPKRPIQMPADTELGEFKFKMKEPENICNPTIPITYQSLMKLLKESKRWDTTESGDEVEHYYTGMFHNLQTKAGMTSAVESITISRRTRQQMVHEVERSGSTLMVFQKSTGVLKVAGKCGLVSQIGSVSSWCRNNMQSRTIIRTDEVTSGMRVTCRWNPEYVCNRLKFSYGWYYTFIQGWVYLALIYLQCFIGKQMVNPWKTYVKLSAVLMGSHGLTKGSLAFLNYPAQLMFKSTKNSWFVMVAGAHAPSCEEMASTMTGAESSVVQGLQQYIDIVTAEVERLLSTEQKPLDYRSANDSLMADHRPTVACTSLPTDIFALGCSLPPLLLCCWLFSGSKSLRNFQLA